jgi:hypothetical protein
MEATIDPARVLSDLRRARRRRRTSDVDVFEALYQSYLTAILVGLAVLLLSGITGDKRVSQETVDRVLRDGPAVIGLVVALAVAVGFRSGGRGGPLVIEAADVRHVLLSPVDRSLALRGPAFRQLRFTSFVGTVVGAIAGLLAFRRLPGTPLYWVLCGAVVGALAAILAIGAAILLSANRVGRAIANLLAIGIIAWSGIDLAEHTTTSPCTLLGRLAIWPLQFSALAFVGVAVAIVVPVVSLLFIGGTSLEAAERRASLAGQLRFAATLQDVRTVVVLRRQLAQERPRTRPWFRLPRPKPGTDGPKRPVWRRGWHGILRWPVARMGRLVVLSAVMSLSLVGVWRGATPLIVLAGLALFVAGLDAVEPLAQDVDHPDRLESVPAVAGELEVRHLPAGSVVMVLVEVVGLLIALAVTRDPGLVLPIGGLLIVPPAVISVAAAAMSVIKGPATAPGTGNFFVPPEAAGFQVMFRVGWPPALCILSLLPLLAARAAHRQGLPYMGPMAAATMGTAILAALTAAWVRFQAAVHTALEMSRPATSGQGGARG